MAHGALHNLGTRLDHRDERLDRQEEDTRRDLNGLEKKLQGQMGLLAGDARAHADSQATQTRRQIEDMQKKLETLESKHRSATVAPRTAATMSASAALPQPGLHPRHRQHRQGHASRASAAGRQGLHRHPAIRAPTHTRGALPRQRQGRTDGWATRLIMLLCAATANANFSATRRRDDRRPLEADLLRLRPLPDRRGAAPGPDGGSRRARPLRHGSEDLGGEGMKQTFDDHRPDAAGLPHICWRSGTAMIRNRRCRTIPRTFNRTGDEMWHGNWNDSATFHSTGDHIRQRVTQELQTIDAEA